MENRRLLMAALLSALILIVWNYIFPPVQSPRLDEAFEGEALSEQQGGAAEERARSERESEAAELSSEPEPLGEEFSAEDAGTAEVVQAPMEHRVRIENERYEAELTNRGAQLRSFRLKKHLTEAGEALELIRGRTVDPYPFAIYRPDGTAHPLNDALFVVEESVSDTGRETVVFRHSSERGVAEKRFTWTPEDLLDITMTVRGRDGYGVLVGPGIQDDNTMDVESRWLGRMATYRQGETSETVTPEKQEGEILLQGRGLRWVALENNFFLAAIIPGQGLKEVTIQPVVQRKAVEGEEARFYPLGDGPAEGTVPEQELVLWSNGPLKLTALFGAKQYSRLAALPYGLEETVRWGFFGFLARPLYWGLEWIHHNMIANYGWAIVLITFLIKLVFFPLTHKSQDSMSKMQALNPKVQAIRNKFRTKLKDRQGRPNLEAQRQMNEEVMAVYKSAGVNPASGCLPILLQMPVFFAFYRLLSTAVELRNAPWIGWIRDLSVPDPYYILPIAMGATSVAMQKMMPASPEPMQRRMMQLMPIMFMIFAFAFPSGLVLYWLTNNILSMGQQALVNRNNARKAAIAKGA